MSDPLPETLILFPGLAGEAAELAALAERLRRNRIVHVLGRAAEADGGSPGLPQMAAEAVRAVRARQPRGPYRLIGYSFGGLIAFEAARLLAASGEIIELAALIDAPYDERYWPAATWLHSQAGRARGHLMRLRGAGPGEAVGRIVRHARRLTAKAGGRLGGSPARRTAPTSAKEAGYAAMARWRPGFYPGVLTLFNSEAGAEFHCDIARLWRDHAAVVETVTLSGGHLALVRAPEVVERLAAALETRLDALESTPLPPAPNSGRPRVLVVTTVPWLSAARLALAFHEAGCSVEALCPRGHALAELEFIGRVHHQRAFAPEQALRHAITAGRPDLIVPCDDRAASQLHRLHARLSPADPEGSRLRGLIADSMGAPSRFPLLHRRALMMALAAAEGVRRLETVPIDDPGSLADRRYPAVLKTDGSWGGQGVAIVRDAGEARSAYARLARPPGLARALKRLLVDRDAQTLAAWLRRERPAISLQRFGPGVPANAAVACWRGEVLATTTVEAIRTADPTGHATAVRHVENADMTRAAERLARRLNLSGLFGLDFVLDPQTGEAQLIEVNPRATPTCHLPGRSGADPVTALAVRLGATGLAARPAKVGDIVALFPHELIRDPHSPLVGAGRHDVPWSSPALVRVGLRLLRKRRGGGTRWPDDARAGTPQAIPTA